MQFVHRSHIVYVIEKKYAQLTSTFPKYEGH